MLNNINPILVVEDEPKLAQLILDYLHKEKFKTIWLQDGADVIDTVQRKTPALVLLDIMLPKANGFSLCEGIRRFSQVPIVILTARGQEEDRLSGFELGADDYICKPFSPREMVSRVKAVLKRAEHPPSPSAASTEKLELDHAGYSARFNGIPLSLTPIEFRILSYLAQSPGRVFSRSELLDRIYPGYRIINDRTIDSHIKNLRRKLKAVAPDSEIVQSVYGMGYKFELST